VPDSTKVVVVGAGLVGCAVAQHLAELGWRDITVVDQGPLFTTGGSSSHAPGLVFQINPSQTMTRLASYTIEHFSGLEHDLGPCFLPAGSIEVAATPERLEWLKLRHGLAASWGVSSSLLSPSQVSELIPLVDAGRVLGGLHVPSDGIAKSVRAIEAMAANASEQGVRFQGNTEVTGVAVEEGSVRGVETSEGHIEANLVVSCAGMWGPLIGRMVGMRIPLLPVQHQYVRTSILKELIDESEEVSHPILRHQDSALYFRQLQNCYGVGSYQHSPLPVAPETILSPADAAIMPSLMPFTEDDFKQAWADATELVPALAETSWEDSLNGLFSFTPDGLPLIGESRAVRGFWVAEAVWVTHSAGVGKVTAQWIAEGTPGMDLRECDINRFEPFATSPSYVNARGCTQYDEVYDVIHPTQPLAEPRPLRVSPFYRRQQELGGSFLEFSGWERPQWYHANEPLTKGREIPAPGEWAARFWSPMVGGEHLVSRERVAMFDMTSLKRAEVRGPGALGFLQRLSSSDLDRKPGYVTYTLMLDANAGIRSDITVARLAADHFQLGLNGPRDINWLERHAAADATVFITDITSGTCCIGLWGPDARKVVQSASRDSFSHEDFGFFRAKEVFIEEVPVVALRLSYVGELGWELYTTADLGLRLWDLLWRAGRSVGIIAAGRGAFTAMRLEKGYRSWGLDMWSEHDPYEAGLGFAVSDNKTEFLGASMLNARKQEGLRRKLCCLTVDDGTVVMGKEPVFFNQEAVGFVTSAAYGYSVDRSIAYAWLPVELADFGTKVDVEYFAQRHTATVSNEPLFDPEMKRMRSTE
jgi:dimethylglycine oxidase